VSPNVKVPPRALLDQGHVASVQVPSVRSIRVGQLMGRYLACSSLAFIHVVPERQALIREARLGPAQRKSVKLLETASLEGVANDGDARRVSAREFAEPRDREEHVLIRV
jgi:hypothetical protein